MRSSIEGHLGKARLMRKIYSHTCSFQSSSKFYISKRGRATTIVRGGQSTYDRMHFQIRFTKLPLSTSIRLRPLWVDCSYNQSIKMGMTSHSSSSLNSIERGLVLGLSRTQYLSDAGFLADRTQFLRKFIVSLMIQNIYLCLC